jgi:glutamate carboxypeptidase
MKFPKLILTAALLVSASAFAQAKDEALINAATAEQPSVMKTLERLVNIESGSTNIEGLNALSNLLAKELEGLGGQVSRHKSTVNTGTENIVGKFAGKGKTKFLMMAHIDTV